jgi:hypothetical protein
MSCIVSGRVFDADVLIKCALLLWGRGRVMNVHMNRSRLTLIVVDTC